MPPVQVIDSNDDVAEMIRFQTSPIYEMILSLQTLIQQRRRATWVNQTRAKLSPEFWEELSTFFENFNLNSFIEFPVDYSNHEDVMGFIEYVRQMDLYDFAFYATGRMLSPQQLVAIGNNQSLYLETIERIYSKEHSCAYDAAKLLPNMETYQRQLTDLWEKYWVSYFAEFVESLKPSWFNGLKEAEYILKTRGSDGLISHLLGKNKTVPDYEVPPGQHVNQVVFVPVYLIPYRGMMFFGHGNVTILYDSEHTEAYAAQIEKGKDEAINIIKALGDSTRLNVLRLVVQGEGKFNGKKIASKLNLSPSVVSRHLTQLRDSGLIVEEPLDHRNITYRFQRESITSLPEKILEYLYS